MCLIVDENLQVSINPEPKMVYKVFRKVNGGLWSRFRDLGWAVGQEYTEEITESTSRVDFCTVSKIDRLQIKAAYPTYESGETNPGLKSIVEGLHYCTDLKTPEELVAGSYEPAEIWECLIPAGAEIIESWGLGVTNKLTVVKPYKP